MDVKNKIVGLIGATSLVGQSVMSILKQSDWHVVAFSRQAKESGESGIEWRQLNSAYPHPSPLDSGSELRSTSSIPGVVPKREGIITAWICIAPIWVLPDYFDLLKSSGAKRVVAVSSTSRFTKEDSAEPYERAIAQKLIDAEVSLQNWAELNEIDWTILRPTMIYGMGKDKNVSEIIRLIRRWGLFPILGKGQGLRQPVHVDDVAKACKVAIISHDIKNGAYNFSGGETLAYNEMVKRIFIALDKKPRLVHLPRWCFYLALYGLRIIPRFRHWSVSMVDRMERDLVFDNKDAIADFSFSPRPFKLTERDLPEE